MSIKETTNRFFDTKSKKMLALLLLILVVSIGLGLLITNDKNQSNIVNKPVNTTTEFLSVPGPRQNEGITLYSLDQLSKFQENRGANNNFVAYVQLVDSANQKGSVYPQSFLSADIQNFRKATTAPKEYLDYANSVLNNPSNSEYENFITSIREFVRKSVTDPNLTVTLAKASKFTNQNITENAWVFDVDINDQSGKSTNYDGKVVFAVGNALYMVFVSADETSWSNNSKVFDSILSSIQVNQ